MPFPYSTTGRVEERWLQAGAGRALLQLVWKDEGGVTRTFHRISRPLNGVLDRIVGHGSAGAVIYSVFLYSVLGVDVLLGEGDALPGFHNEKVIVKLLTGANLTRPLLLAGPHYFSKTAAAGNLWGTLDVFYWTNVAMALEARAVF